MGSKPPTTINFEELGFGIMRPGKTISKKIGNRNRRFKGWFGTDAFIVAIIWKNLFKIGWIAHVRSQNPVQLLLALSFMQTYATEDNMASLFGGIDKKNMRKLVWFYANGISEMASKVVSS